VTAATIDTMTLLLAVSYRRFGTERRLSDDQYSTEATDKSAVNATKARLVSKALDKIAAFDSQTQKALARKTLPSLIHPGVVRVHRDALAEIVGWLEGRKVSRDGLVAGSFVPSYPSDVEKTAAKLGPLYDPEDYPTAEDAAKEFGFDWRVLSAAVPEGLPEGVQATEEARYRAQLDEAVASYTKLLRGAAADIVGDLAACLDKTTDALGRKNPVRIATLNRIREFVQTFPTRNVGGDAALGILIGQAGAMLDQLGAGDPNDDATRSALAAGFGAMREQLNALADGVGATRKRKIKLVDDAA
jgi:hypothetical protein